MSFTWDPDKRKFVDAGGHVVSEAKLRNWVASMTDASASKFTARALRVKGGTKDAEDWAIEMRTDLDSLHNVATIVAGGGVGQMRDEFWRYAEDEIAFHLGYFSNFAAGVLSGQVEKNDAFVQRNALYAEAGYPTFENALAIREFSAGLNLHRRVLSPGENCVDCIQFAGMGWQTRGQLPRIGDSICRTRCRCHFKFKEGTVDDIGKLRFAPCFLPPRFATL